MLVDTEYLNAVRVENNDKRNTIIIVQLDLWYTIRFESIFNYIFFNSISIDWSNRNFIWKSTNLSEDRIAADSCPILKII